MQQIRDIYEKKGKKGNIKLKKTMHFLVFGDSKGSKHLKDVLHRADQLNPQFCITTADLVNRGGGDIGEKLYQDPDSDSGVKNFGDFFGLKDPSIVLLMAMPNLLLWVGSKSLKVRNVLSGLKKN